MPRRKSTKTSTLKERVAERRASLSSPNSYKSLFYGVATVIILFIIGFGAVKLLINRPEPAIDNQAVSIQNLTTNTTSPTEAVETPMPTIEATATPTVAIATSTPTPTTKVASATPTLVVKKPTPTVAPKPVAQAPKGSRTYTVKAGESLWDIAVSQYKDGYKWIQIAKANNIQNPGTIFKDDKLVIPQEEITPTPAVKQDTTLSQGNMPTTPMTGDKITGATYVVRRGDDLWDIAVRAYGDGYKWVEIARANNLTNPNLIHSDNILKLPR